MAPSGSNPRPAGPVTHPRAIASPYALSRPDPWRAGLRRASLFAPALLLTGCAGGFSLPGAPARPERTRISDAPAAMPLKPPSNQIVAAVDKVAGPEVVAVPVVC